VAGNSASEEEVALLTHPEALLGLLLCAAPMRDDEAVLVHGALRYCSCRGAGHSFAFGEAAAPETWRDAPSTLLWLDPLRRPSTAQFHPDTVRREVCSDRH